LPDSGGAGDFLKQHLGSVTHQGSGPQKKETKNGSDKGVPPAAGPQAEHGENQTEHAEGYAGKNHHN